MESLTQLSAVERRIPTFDAWGRRIRPYSEDRIRNLISLGRMTAMVNRGGVILFAQFLRVDRSYRRPASKPKGKLIIRETELPGVDACSALFAVPADMDRDELAAYQRGIFQQVLISIGGGLPNVDLVARIRERKRKRRAKVVSIDAYRRNELPVTRPERKAA